jgi:multiple sugar transport system permease protein
MEPISKQRVKYGAGSLAINIQLIVLLLLFLLPVLWLISASFKSVDEMFSSNLHFIPRAFTVDNYIRIWDVIPYAHYLKNSVLIAVYTSIVTLFFSALAAYSFSRFKYPGRKLIMGFMLLGQMFPAILLIIPMFIYMNKLGIAGDYLAVVLAYQTFLLPFCSWALTNFFNKIPVELDEAAIIDGCTRFQVMYKIILPVALPGLISVATYSFLGSWNEFIFTMTLMQDNFRWTVPVGLNALSGQYGVDWGLLTAGGVICLVPAVLVMLILQKFLIQGNMEGSIKT